ncbi:hypothetical protein JL721_963 [Aureococcus anophagefferens]|nr:hypothetical protein JL721_963 [Aureococcus anophagefferens]
MAEELAMVRRNVEREDAVAIRHLARAYQAGNWDIAVNLKKAAKLYKRAAELGDADACFSLAYAYDDGDGVRQNKAKALAFWRRAAAQDHDVRTKCNAETVLFLSLSIASDGPTPEAVALVRDAAGRGYAEAEYHLADLHLDGAGGVPQDTREAKRLLANAAARATAPSSRTWGRRSSRSRTARQGPRAWPGAEGLPIVPGQDRLRRVSPLSSTVPK